MVEGIKLEQWQLDALQLALGQRQQIESEFGRLRDLLQKNQTTMDGMRAAWGFAPNTNYEHVGDGVFLPKLTDLAPGSAVEAPAKPSRQVQRATRRKATEPVPIRKEEAV